MSAGFLAIASVCALALVGLGFALGLWFAHRAMMDALRSMKL